MGFATVGSAVVQRVRCLRLSEFLGISTRASFAGTCWRCLQVLGLSDDFGKPQREKSSIDNLQFIPPTIDHAPKTESQIAEPLPVNDFGNPAPFLHPPYPAPVAAQELADAASKPPVPEHAPAASATAPDVPGTSAHVPFQASGFAAPADSAAAPAPGYMEAINAAMRGATTGDKPLLDAANPGPEGYMGAHVHGSVGSASAIRGAYCCTCTCPMTVCLSLLQESSRVLTMYLQLGFPCRHLSFVRVDADSIPAVPPAAAQVQASDLLFPDVKWMDAPPVPPQGGGVASLSGQLTP